MKRKNPTKTKAADAAESFRSGTNRAPTPQETVAATDWAGAVFSIGHQPTVELSAAQKQLFQSFQANLVSLLSHELRTPLMSILNALSAIDEQGRAVGGMSVTAALDMARKNARKLEAALSTVLDLAAWEAGVLQIQLAETSLSDCLQHSTLAHLVPASLTTQPEIPDDSRILADPSKLARALSRLQDFAESCGTELQIDLQPRRFHLQVALNTNALSERDWQALWHEVLVAREAGGSLPLHVFAGVLQSERAFLSRSREGLGAELHLIAEILRQHEASFQGELAPGKAGPKLSFTIDLPKIEGRGRVLRLLRSRIWRPGSTSPEPLLARLYRRNPGSLPNLFALDPKIGPWLELVDPRSSTGAIPAGAIQMRCPEDGHDPELLLSRLLSG